MFKGKFSAQWICCTGLLLLMLLASAPFVLAADEEILFLHHSTGGNVYSEGDVPEWIDAYNDDSGTNYHIQEWAYPRSMGNNPYDYWNLWVNGECGDGDNECLDAMASDYEIGRAHV